MCKKVLIIAEDNRLAAAIEQLYIWANRTGAEIIKTQTGLILPLLSIRDSVLPLPRATTWF